MKYLFYLMFNFNLTAFKLFKSFVPNDFCGSDEIHKEKIKNDREYCHSQTIENIKQAQV